MTFIIIIIIIIIIMIKRDHISKVNLTGELKDIYLIKLELR